jgi:hypothetical protein
MLTDRPVSQGLAGCEVGLIVRGVGVAKAHSHTVVSRSFFLCCDSFFSCNIPFLYYDYD